MQNEEIVLYPTTHEQSLPTFHVKKEVKDAFLQFLTAHDFHVAESVEPVGDGSVYEIRLELEAAKEELEKAKTDFLNSRAAT